MNGNVEKLRKIHKYFTVMYTILFLFSDEIYKPTFDALCILSSIILLYAPIWLV